MHSVGYRNTVSVSAAEHFCVSGGCPFSKRSPFKRGKQMFSYASTLPVAVWVTVLIKGECKYSPQYSSCRDKRDSNPLKVGKSRKKRDRGGSAEAPKVVKDESECGRTPPPLLPPPQLHSGWLDVSTSGDDDDGNYDGKGNYEKDIEQSVYKMGKK
ncbi:hypothetical protein LSTR_LSTR010347 [Laodelphax striatellus]|uniref:Uncharacterized protein n=1 Tax=Laodelphax striatellus TaxID=195883 RepID=A0A482X0L7_LAOST|nr:hypothetical protein LSTR_LSTR010347 [Laodelphax striatellus]